MVVICAANRFDGIKVADQHIAEHLSKLVPVLYVDPPTSWAASTGAGLLHASAYKSPLQMVGPSLARLTPVVQPGASRRGLTSVASALTRQHIRHATQRLAGRVQAVVSAWANFPVFDSAGERLRIYWAQDDYVGGAALLGFNAQRLEAQERGVAEAAHVVIAANPVVAETWRARGLRTVLIPYGADLEAYEDVDRAPPVPDVSLSGPIVGFIGQINDRMDLALLEAIADRGRALLLVGPRSAAFEPQRFGALLQRPNVAWVGSKPFDALPSYLRLIDVGIVPYRDTPFNRGSFPLKTLEYLAAGRPVVATDLPAIRWLATDLIAIASGPRQFADHVDVMLKGAKSAGERARRRDFAAKHSWAKRAEEIYQVIRTGS
jgi:teichuronic acid biosynthesis glycosyltransferase TuaH